jgi:hypothetical protein
MAERTATCGFRCDLCPAFERNRVDPVRTSAAWSALWGVELAPERLRCRGCGVPAPRGAALPEPGCPVRACATGRNVSGCAACPECPCAQLERRLTSVEAVAARWRRRLSPDAYALFVEPYLARAALPSARPTAGEPAAAEDPTASATLPRR